MRRKLNIRWSRGAAKAMRSKLRAAGVRVSDTSQPVRARLELVVEVDGDEKRISVPLSYLLVAPADAKSIAHLIEIERDA